MVPSNGPNTPASVAVNLNELIDYQEGSVVSRTLIAGDKGTVTLFAFDQGQGLSEHTAPFDALVQVLEGRASITISGKTLELSQGQSVLMPANEPHALRGLNRFKMLLTMIRE